MRWVYTDRPFLEPGTGSVVNNRIWNEDFYSDIPIGQVQEVIANYKQDARWKFPPGFKSDHMCHPEWFTTGEPFPNDLPPQEYSEDQIPLCCGGIPDVPRGGVSIGGAVGDRYYGSNPSSGGCVLGGAVGDVFRPPDPTAGGVEMGGSAGDVYTPATGTEGGMEIGGETGDAFKTSDPTEGGMEIGGEVGDVFPSGEWIRDSHGEYDFVPEFTGGHLLVFYGAGGAGADGDTSGPDALGGGGGGGGAESNSIVTLTEGVTYQVFVGAGGFPGTPATDTYMERTGFPIIIKAVGGDNATSIGGASGGLAGSGIGDQRWSGGDGGDSGALVPGGGGGSSAVYSPTSSPLGDGNPGVLSVGGTPPLPDGGQGGDGGAVGANGNDGGGPGGAGGGGGAGTTTGGNGHDGKVIIRWPAG